MSNLFWVLSALGIILMALVTFYKKELSEIGRYYLLVLTRQIQSKQIQQFASLASLASTKVIVFESGVWYTVTLKVAGTVFEYIYEDGEPVEIQQRSAYTDVVQKKLKLHIHKLNMVNQLLIVPNVDYLIE